MEKHMPNVVEDREKAMDNPQYEDVFLNDRISLAHKWSVLDVRSGKRLSGSGFCDTDDAKFCKIRR
jgi:hypothetical protein